MADGTRIDPSPDAAREATRRAWIWFAVVAVGVVALYAPALRSGYLADDLFQISMIEGLFHDARPWGLYSFVPDDPAATLEHVRRGTLPWWTAPHFRFVMVRPLASLTIALDHALLPRHAWVHHVHSMLWLLAALAAAYAVLRRSTTAAIAGLALVLFSVDETVAWMVAWIANRCTLVSAAFGLLALALHVRARGRGPLSGRDRLVALLLWALAFAGGEYALGVASYLLAFELVAAPGGWRERAMALAPATIALTVFMVAYLVVGGGVYGATTYIDPFGDPVHFLELAGHRILRMAGEVWLNFAGESERFWLRYQGLAAWVMPEDGSDLMVQVWRHARFSAMAVVVVVVPSWLLARRHLEPAERRAVAWMALGSVLALIPLAAIPPATRSLLLPNLGAAVLVAAVAVAAFRAGRVRRARGRGWPGRLALVGFATLLLWSHGIREVSYVREQLGALAGAQRAYEEFYANESFTSLDVADKDVVVIAAPGLVTGIHGLSMLNLLGRPLPRSWHVLAMGDRPYLVRRFGRDTLEVGAVGSGMHYGPHEALFRPVSEALTLGDEVDAGVFRAEVIHERPGKGPDVVLFRFRRPLDDPSLVFLEVGPRGLQPFAIPPEQRTVAVKPPKLPRVLPRG